MPINDKILTKIGKSVVKGATEDIKAYLENSVNLTNNAIAFLRGDYISTNMNMMLGSDEGIHIRLFKRSAWTGVLVIDDPDHAIISVCSRKTLNRIPKKKRQSPHYMQSILNSVNKDEHAKARQMTLVDLDPTFEMPFTEEDYARDFLSIMNEAVETYDGYRFWVVAYEVEGSTIKALSALLLDADFDMVQEIPMMDMLKPNFGDLTTNEPKQEQKKDVRSLLSVKPGIKAGTSNEPEKRTEVMPKSAEVEEKKEA